MRDEKLTNISYWERFWKRHESEKSPEKLHEDSHLEPYLSGMLPINSDWSCLEIGVVPGSLLFWFVKHFGYRPVGIDFSPQLTAVADAFEREGFHGEFINADFLGWDPQGYFDVVFSCGFVEHFTDYQTIILKHWAIVRPGGFMIISIPAWTLIQKTIRKILYTTEHWQEILISHNTQMMKLDKLSKAVHGCPGSRILLAQYIREMTVWIKPGQAGVRRRMTPLFMPIRLLEKMLRFLRLSSSLYSPEILVVARKEKEGDSHI